MAAKKVGRKKGKGKHATYLDPGVYVEEVPSSSKPIEGVGTSVAAFVGLAPLSPARAAVSGLALVGGVAVVLWLVRGRSG